MISSGGSCSRNSYRNSNGDKNTHILAHKLTFKDKLAYHNSNTNGRKYDVRRMNEQINVLIKSKKIIKWNIKPKDNQQWKALQKSYNIKESLNGGDKNENVKE